jgi:hypothetical protein
MDDAFGALTAAGVAWAVIRNFERPLHDFDAGGADDVDVADEAEGFQGKGGTHGRKVDQHVKWGAARATRFACDIGQRILLRPDIDDFNSVNDPVSACENAKRFAHHKMCIQKSRKSWGTPAQQAGTHVGASTPVAKQNKSYPANSRTRGRRRSALKQAEEITESGGSRSGGKGVRSF